MLCKDDRNLVGVLLRIRRPVSRSASAPFAPPPRTTDLASPPLAPSTLPPVPAPLDPVNPGLLTAPAPSGFPHEGAAATEGGGGVGGGGAGRSTGLEVFGATSTGFFGADTGGSAGAEAGEGSSWRCLFRADWTRGLGKTAVGGKGQAAGF